MFLFRSVVNNKGQNGEKRHTAKQTETEEQLPKHNNKKTLLMDMTSQIESISYRISGLSHLP